MKILLLGSGGREHALAWKIAQSEKCEKLYIAPGNAGTANCGINIPMKADDFEVIKQFVVAEGIDMVVVGPEDPLVKGIYDDLKTDERTKNVPVIGPSKAGAVQFITATFKPDVLPPCPRIPAAIPFEVSVVDTLALLVQLAITARCGVLPPLFTPPIIPPTLCPVADTVTELSVER